MASRSVDIRLAVQGSTEARARLLALGAEGEAALAKIEASGASASRGLGHLDQASGRAGRAARGLGSDIGALARDVATGNASIESLITSVTLAATRFGLWGLAAAAAITGGVALWQTFSDLGDETDDAADAAERMSDIQSALKGLVGDSTVAIRDQVIEVSRLGEEARESSLALVELRGDLAELARGQALDKIRETVDELQSTLLQPSGSEIIGRGPILEALAAISEAQASDDPSKLAASISRLVRQMEDPKLVGSSEALAKWSAEAIRLESEIRSIETALDDVAKGGAKTSKEIEASTRDAAKSAEQAARETERQAAQAAAQAERSAEQRRRTADRELEALRKMAQQIDREAAKASAVDGKAAEQQAAQARAQLEREADASARVMMRPFETPLCTMSAPFRAIAESYLA